MKDLNERLVKTELVYDGVLLRVNRDEARLPDGSKGVREWIAHPGATAVIPLTDRGSVILVKQFRYPLGKVTVEIPAGKLDPGEDPLVCAHRELQEETGLTAAKLNYVGSFVTTPAFTDEIIHLYVGTGLTAGEISTDEDEFIEVEERSLDEVFQAIEGGEIKDAKTMIAFMLADRKGMLTPEEV